MVNQHHNISHEKVISVPLGVKSGDDVRRAAHKFLKTHSAPGRKARGKNRLLFTATSDYAFRRRIKACVARAMGSRGPAALGQPVPQSDFFDGLIRACTVLCPPGLGYDTYRLWETLALGAVPVLERGFGLERSLHRLPALLVDDFSELRPLMLKQAYVQALYLADKWEYRRLTKAHWARLVSDASRTGDVAGMLRWHPMAAADSDFVRPLIPLGFDCKAAGKRCPAQSCAINASLLQAGYNWGWHHDTPGPPDDGRRLASTGDKLLVLVAEDASSAALVASLYDGKNTSTDGVALVVFTRAATAEGLRQLHAEVLLCSAVEPGTSACAIDALHRACTAHPSSHVLLLVYSGGSAPLLGASAAAAFDSLLLQRRDLLLLPRTRRLDSVSGWHDLQVVFAASGKLRGGFTDRLQRVYRSYAVRTAFAMSQPRPALLEAVVEHRSRGGSVGYLEPAAACAFHGGMHHRQHRAGSALPDSCGPDGKGTATIRIYCGSGAEEADRACSMLGQSRAWVQDIVREGGVAELEDKLELARARWKRDLPDAMDAGALRYRLADSATEPRKHCFLREEPQAAALPQPRSLIYDNHSSHRTPEPWNASQSAHSPQVVMFTGDSGSWRSVDKYMYESLSKMHYAKTHGYKFVFQPSRRFERYYPRDLFASLGRDGDSERYFRAVMTKPLLLLDVMLQNPNAEWVFFLDADAWINLEWIDLPLAAFLQDVPPHKLWVHANYRSLLTGAFLVRNSARGRALVRDWLAVAMSGQVSCHGFDQAALEVVFMQRQGPGGCNTTTPFNLSALETKFGGWGCSGGADWSVDYKFERQLNRMGFRTRNSGFWSDISSYSRGCANDFVADFHVAAETSTRPRLQCFHCGSESEIRAGVWDGPLGGSNDRVLAGAINGYFSNHKANWLFHQTHLSSSSCSRGAFLQSCSTERSSLLSLTDGFALDLEAGTFCELGGEARDEQRSVSYMKDYPAAIAAAAAYSQALWDSQYRALGGSESRGNRCSKLGSQQRPATSSCGEDGLLWRDKSSDWFLLPRDYCRACSAVDSATLGGKAVDCTGLNM